MARSGLLFVAVLLALACKPIHASDDGSRPLKQDIPQRCKDNSVTAVSCKDVVSEDALAPHPDDCELFYYCVSPDHAPICRQCPAQLHFNPAKHVCDAPERAGCVANTSAKR